MVFSHVGSNHSCICLLCQTNFTCMIRPEEVVQGPPHLASTLGQTVLAVSLALDFLRLHPQHTVMGVMGAV